MYNTCQLTKKTFFSHPYLEQDSQLPNAIIFFSLWQPLHIVSSYQVGIEDAHQRPIAPSFRHARKKFMRAFQHGTLLRNPIFIHVRRYSVGQPSPFPRGKKHVSTPDGSPQPSWMCAGNEFLGKLLAFPLFQCSEWLLWISLVFYKHRELQYRVGELNFNNDLQIMGFSSRLFVHIADMGDKTIVPWSIVVPRLSQLDQGLSHDALAGKIVVTAQSRSIMVSSHHSRYPGFTFRGPGLPLNGIGRSNGKKKPLIQAIRLWNSRDFVLRTLSYLWMSNGAFGQYQRTPCLSWRVFYFRGDDND